MTDTTGFTLAVAQAEYLPVDQRDLHAVLYVGHAGNGGPPDGGEVAEVLVVDCSSSMSWPPTKIAAARQATAAAIDQLRDGTRFAIVAGTDLARQVYPPGQFTVVADRRTRAAAQRAVADLQASGGTAIGRWLHFADDILRQVPSTIRHVTLLTDGQNGEPAATLREALSRCRSTFTCDARGIGDDWNPKELMEIAEALRGTASAVGAEHELAGDFREIVERLMGKSVAELRIRITLSPFADVRWIHQTFPTKLDLTDHLVRRDARTLEVPTGAWGDENREYELSLHVGEHGMLDVPMKAGRVELLTDSTAPPAAPLLLRRTADPESVAPESSLIITQKQQDLSIAIWDGCEAWYGNDHERAVREWTRAVRLARAVGDTQKLFALRKVVAFDLPADGPVTLLPGATQGDVKRLELQALDSVQSRRVTDAAPEEPAASGPDKTCGSCGRISPSQARFCTACNEPLS